jgi:hypothetical protein
VYDFPAGSVCPFHVSVEFTRREGSIFVFSNGVIKFAYTFWLNVTNVDAGQTRVLHEAGTIIFTPLSGDVTESVTAGKELNAYFPGDLGPGSPGALLFTTGRLRDVNSGPEGLTLLSHEILAGSAEDLCVTMA